MPSSFCQVAIHLIFGLRRRQKFLTKDVQSYIHGIITQIKGVPIQVGGTTDHVHILCYLPKDQSISDFVRIIKANSSKWHNEQGFGVMHWQTGYAVYSVSKTNLSNVSDYIANQEEHHRKVSFADEMKQYLGCKTGLKVWSDWFGEESM